MIHSACLPDRYIPHSCAIYIYIYISLKPCLSTCDLANYYCKMVKSGATALVVSVVVMAHVVAALGCIDLGPSMVQCSLYATGVVREPSLACCNELRRLNGRAQTTIDRRRICFCYKQLVPQYPNMRDAALAALPRLCGVSMPFLVSRNIDCSK